MPLKAKVLLLEIPTPVLQGLLWGSALCRSCLSLAITVWFPAQHMWHEDMTCPNHPAPHAPCQVCTWRPLAPRPVLREGVQSHVCWGDDGDLCLLAFKMVLECFKVKNNPTPYDLGLLHPGVAPMLSAWISKSWYSALSDSTPCILFVSLVLFLDFPTWA